MKDPSSEEAELGALVIADVMVSITHIAIALGRKVD
jgi:hypothetical protein